MQTVVETPSYLADAERLFSPDERRAIVDRLASDPTCGVVIPGSGGIRKVRFGFGARGKSGGAHIIYLFSGANLPVFALAAFAKNEKANLSAAERNALARMVEALIKDYRRAKWRRARSTRSRLGSKTQKRIWMVQPTAGLLAFMFHHESM